MLKFNLYLFAFLCLTNCNPPKELALEVQRSTTARSSPSPLEYHSNPSPEYSHTSMLQLVNRYICNTLFPRFDLNPTPYDWIHCFWLGRYIPDIYIVTLDRFLPCSSKCFPGYKLCLWIDDRYLTKSEINKINKFTSCAGINLQYVTKKKWWYESKLAFNQNRELLLPLHSGRLMEDVENSTQISTEERERLLETLKHQANECKGSIMYNTPHTSICCHQVDGYRLDPGILKYGFYMDLDTLRDAIDHSNRDKVYGPMIEEKEYGEIIFPSVSSLHETMKAKNIGVLFNIEKFNVYEQNILLLSTSIVIGEEHTGILSALRKMYALADLNYPAPKTDLTFPRCYKYISTETRVNVLSNEDSIKFICGLDETMSSVPQMRDFRLTLLSHIDLGNQLPDILGMYVMLCTLIKAENIYSLSEIQDITTGLFCISFEKKQSDSLPLNKDLLYLVLESIQHIKKYSLCEYIWFPDDFKTDQSYVNAFRFNMKSWGYFIKHKEKLKLGLGCNEFLDPLGFFNKHSAPE